MEAFKVDATFFLKKTCYQGNIDIIDVGRILCHYIVEKLIFLNLHQIRYSLCNWHY